MIRIDQEYCNGTQDFDDTDPKYPAGKAVPYSPSENIDGTPWRALLFNDINGFRQALVKRVWGEIADNISGVPDDSDDSDVLNALIQLIMDLTGGEGFNRRSTQTLTTSTNTVTIPLDMNTAFFYGVFVNRQNYEPDVDFTLTGRNIVFNNSLDVGTVVTIWYKMNTNIQFEDAWFSLDSSLGLPRSERMRLARRTAK